MDGRVEVTISEGVADVRLVRADKMNALDAAMFDALVATSGRLAHEKGLRAVVLSGEGRAFCGGFQLALGADIRFLAPDARMSIMEIKWGLVPDMAGTPILASLVRDDILRDLTYTGRIFSAQEAMSYGLATRICDDPRAAAFDAAREIAGNSPDAIRAAKRMLNN